MTQQPKFANLSSKVQPCRTRSLAAVIMMLLLCFGAKAQETQREFRVEFLIGKSTIDPNFANNAKVLSDIEALLKNIDGTNRITKVEFRGNASPDGGTGVNKRLAGLRRAALEAYITQRTQISPDIISHVDGFIAWEQLAELVEKSDMPHKDEVLDVLSNVPEFTYNSRGALIDSRKKHLMELQYGRSWNYMYRNFYPAMRNASSVIITFKEEPKPEPQPEPQPEPVIVPEPQPEPQPVVTPEPEPQPEPAVVPEQKPFYMAAKTNLLYDVLAVPAVGLEFYLGKDWSLSGDWMYGWWSRDKSHRYWRIYGGGLTLRRWFGKAAEEKPLTGHHLGVYGQIFTYDFEWGGKGQMGGKPGGTLWERMNYAAGIEYGYSLPIGRRLNLDFSAGIGYWGGRYLEYKPLDGCYVWQKTKERHWLGPTKAEISLVWLLGRGNTNNKKGGTK